VNGQSLTSDQESYYYALFLTVRSRTCLFCVSFDLYKVRANNNHSFDVVKTRDRKAKPTCALP